MKTTVKLSTEGARDFDQEIELTGASVADVSQQAQAMLWAAAIHGASAVVWLPGESESWTNEGMFNKPTPTPLEHSVGVALERLHARPDIDEIVTAGLNNVFDMLLTEHGWQGTDALADAAAKAAREYAVKAFSGDVAGLVEVDLKQYRHKSAS